MTGEKGEIGHQALEFLLRCMILLESYVLERDFQI